MTKKYCDRCGVERRELTAIKIPCEIHENGDFSVREIEVCEKCNEIHIKILKSLTDMRFSLYENVFGM